MNPIVLAYVPPVQKFHPEVFVANIRRFANDVPVLLFSDAWPDTIRISHSPEMVRRHANPANPLKDWSVNNMVFFTGLRIAAKHKATHVLYVEADSRVNGDHWADRVFEEYFAHGSALIGGSMVLYNPCNAGAEAARRCHETMARNTRKNFPIPIYGWKGAADGTGSCVFVNGSLGIYDMAEMALLFDLEKTADLSLKSTAWDMEVGVRLWAKYGADTYDRVAHLTTVFSSYGEVLTTEAQRLDMLRNGEIWGVHQIKSSATI